MKVLLRKVAGFFSSTKAKVLAWNFQQKIVAGVTAAAIVTGSTTAGIIVHRANAQAQPEEEQIEVAEEEIPEEVEIKGNKVEVPSFTQVSLSSDSMVQDLKLYFKGADGKRISGVPFSVVITTEKKASAVSPSVKTIQIDNKLLEMLDSTGLGAIEYNKALGEKIDGIVEAHSEKVAGAEDDLKTLFVTEGEQAAREEDGATAKSSDEELLLNAATDKPITVTEFYLIKKQNDIAAYATALSSIDGKKYSDDDGDGIIKIDKIDGGKYITLYVPQTGYDAKTYENNVTVKAELEYKKVENIKEEVVKDAGDTKPADAAQVEAKLTDTVEFVKPGKSSDWSYTATSAPAYKAAPSGTPATAATPDGGSVSVTSNSGTLYALKSADANSMNVTVSAKAGTGEGQITNITASSSTDAIKVKAGSNGNYTISTASGTKSTSGTVTFTADYKYKKATTSTKRNTGNKHVAAAKKTYIATPAVAKKTGGGFIRTAATPTPVDGGTPETQPAAGEDKASGESGKTPGEGENTPQTFAVKFDTNGGKETYPEQQVKNGEYATDPGTPTKDNGAKFLGWYNGETKFEFTTMQIRGAITLEARWDEPEEPAAVTYTDATEKITVTVSVKVIGSETAVTTADGQKLYSAKSTKNPATLADVAAGKTLYTAKETILYTGMQHIDGKTYYFTKDHQKVTGEQVIQGIKYTFGADGVLLPGGMGVDVSKWQGNIDWGALAPNVSFAIIRCGYRGSSGGLSVDPQYARNMQQAKAHGVRVGIYIYSKATNEAMAVEEASLAIQLAQEQGGVSLPIYMDMEDGSQKGLSKDQATSIANAFCATVASAGYRPGVYASYNWWNNRLNAGSVNGSKWVARYNTQCGMACDIWQYSSKGTLPGIGGNVDINQSYF